MEEIMKLAVGNGLWATLFCFLFIYMLRDSKSRENKYINLIDTLSSDLSKAISNLKEVENVQRTLQIASDEHAKLRVGVEGIKEELIKLRVGIGG